MAAPLLAFHKKFHDPRPRSRAAANNMHAHEDLRLSTELGSAHGWPTPKEVAIGEELSIMGCRKPGLRIVSYEIGKRDRFVLVSSVFQGCMVFTSLRQDLYKGGGLISVTSRINEHLVLDRVRISAAQPVSAISGYNTNPSLFRFSPYVWV